MPMKLVNYAQSTVDSACMAHMLDYIEVYIHILRFWESGSIRRRMYTL